MTTLTPYERVQKALKGEAVDRPPLLFWHHFVPRGSGERLAKYTLEFFVEKFRLDIVKVMPDLPYPVPEIPVTSAKQLRDLPRLSIDLPVFQEQLTCIKKLRSVLGNEYPLLVTRFSPLTYAIRFIGKKKFMKIAREDPESFIAGVKIITENLRIIMAEEIKAGASGIFFSCMGATEEQFTPEEYAHFGHPYDLQALEAVSGGWLNTVHVHADPDQKGVGIYFEKFLDYPVSVISWSDALGGPHIKQALGMTDKCLMAGLWERGPLVNGDEKAIKQEIDAAVKQTKGKHLILANGCSLPNDVPEKWLHIARDYINSFNF